MVDFSAYSIATIILLFGAAALVVAICGILMTGLADVIADRTGFGEALVGGVLLGASTSLSGTVTSVVAASGGHPELAASNAIGGIAGQTAFLAIADVVYRRANLEHAAASATNLTQAGLLIVLLSIPLLAGTLPSWTILGIHPATGILVLTYAFGVRLATAARTEPMWRAADTDETRVDAPEDEARSGRPTQLLVAQFCCLGVLVGIAGWLIAATGLQISARSGISETVVGALLTATATSLPELVTTLAAVRRGALQLAVGGIVGGNTFDVLFLALSDVAYREGSLYHEMGTRVQFWTALAVLMTGVLLLGLLRREKHGFANIGFESSVILALYGGAIAIQVYLG